MRKLIAAMNMTLDGICDHTAMIADDEIHEHYNELLRTAGGMIYGRVTYQLMESYWPTIVKKPTGNKPTDDFANLLHGLPKIVFSRTLKKLQWENSVLADRNVKEVVEALKQEPGKDLFVGSPSLIVETMNLGLVDECQFSVQPIIQHEGMQLFKNIAERIEMELTHTKQFSCGAITLYYKMMNSKS